MQSGQANVLLFHILPFMELGAINEGSGGNRDTVIPGNTNGDGTPRGTTIPAFFCPSATENDDGRLNANWAVGNYGFNYQAFARPVDLTTRLARQPPAGYYPEEYEPKQSMAAWTDGTSNVIIYGEMYGKNSTNAALWCHGNWTLAWMPMFAGMDLEMFQVRVKRANAVTGRAATSHPSGMNVGIGDGSVRFVSGNISSNTSVTVPGTWQMALFPNDGGPLRDDWN